ncbi:hypothetical protein P9B03_11170 [Metasolibacillus meyeri]|uniref:Uncharacterized protein n=1 Tax=Metasolibacillus meyeri TaxID=1071052 RepID=A0AAW9NSX8_9BACL|nr:hypothetical protein [Metasolibacillus meyeri]MEC1179045.1 hypothetical protein [Metasolibacillus meyeri]
MDVIELIKENIYIFFVIAIFLVLIQFFINHVYITMKNKFILTKIYKNIIVQNFLNAILPVILLAILTAFQQKYELINFGKKENYLTLVISILTLYGILYAFLQFTISYALQNKNDKHWGRSITKDFFLSYLGFEMFKSTFFKITLLYVVIYPVLGNIIPLEIKFFNIYFQHSIADAVWEVGLLVICILYVYLFLQSLSGMKILYDIQEKRNLWLELKIQDKIIEKYKKYFDYSYKQNNDNFCEILFDELKLLNSNEQVDMLMSILGEIFGTGRLPKVRKKGLFKIFNKDEQIWENRSFYINNLFNKLYEEIEKNNIELSLQGALVIYRWHDNAIIDTLINRRNSDDTKNKDFCIDLIAIYSSRDNFRYDMECTYFKLPSIIKSCIASCEDIERIHSYIVNRQGFMNQGSLADKEPYNMMVESYYRYFQSMLHSYGSYFNKLGYRYYSNFFGVHRNRFMNEQESEIIYDYLINLEYTEDSKEYALFLINKLDFKYRASFVFYNILYTGSSRKWEKDILLFEKIINQNWLDESIYDKNILEFVCTKIKNSNIGHRINSDLIKWIIKNMTISQLNEEVLERCSSERNFSYSQFIKLKYIFNQDYYCSLNLNTVDLNKTSFKSYSDWKIGFVKNILQTPKLLKTSFFSQQVYYVCSKISYEREHFQMENDFRLFLVNHSFKLSEDKFIDMIENYYLGKGIIEFLILQLGELEYKYLIDGVCDKPFALRVRAVIRGLNISVSSYIDGLVNQVNECGNEIISSIEKDEIIRVVEKMVKVNKE